MEYIRKEEPNTRRAMTLFEKVKALEKRVDISEKDEETKVKTKVFKWPFKWRRKFSQTRKKINDEKVLVVFLNKKNEMEPPKFMPIFDGNMVVWRNKPYEFDPRAVWTVKGMKGNPQAYLIKEVDRRPISNLDLDEIRERGDSTESDEFLIKAALKAQQSQSKKNINVAAMVIVGLILVGGLIWFFTKGG